MTWDANKDSETMRYKVPIKVTLSFYKLFPAAVGTCAKFQIASMKVETEKFEVLYSLILTSIIKVPNYRKCSLNERVWYDEINTLNILIALYPPS